MRLTDYWRMGRSHGWALPLAFFREAHWYDLRYRTSTATRVAVADFDVEPALRGGAVLYMASWTSTVRHVYNYMRRRLGRDFPNLRVIDVGCGKGKFLCVWSDMLRKDSCQQSVNGLDFSSEFIRTARANLDRRGFFSVHLSMADAVDADLGLDAVTPTLIYIYNPFAEDTMKRFLERLDESDTWIAYCNPIHGDTVLEAGFSLVLEWSDWHPNQWVRLYHRGQESTSWPNHSSDGPKSLQ